MAAGAQLDKLTPNPGTGPGSGSGPGGGAGAGLDRLQGAWRQAGTRWSAMEPRQRRWLAVGALLLASALGVLVWSATRTDWRTLYAGMDPEDARQISEVLTQAQIPFELSDSGAVIRVPAGVLDKARLATSAKGGPRSGRLGFELFDKPNWVGSEFDEQVNYQRALEGELEHTVATLADVKSARVHLVLPNDSLFRDQQRPAKAAVVLTLRHRTLADGEDEAIRNLVASAVDGLAPAQVALVDASGNQPLGAKTPEALRLSQEQALEAKLIETLEPVTGQGNVRASVTVDYDPVATDQTEENYDPDQTVTLSMQRSEQTAGAQPIPAGVPGTASNAPNASAQPVYPPQTTSPQSAKTESGTYGVSRTVRHTTEEAGHMRRLTAAIVVNDRLTAKATKAKGASWQPRTPEELRLLTALAQAAVGFDGTRGDVVTVEDLAFDENRNVETVSPAMEAVTMAERSPLLLKYSALLVGLLLLILLGIRPAFKGPGAAKAAKGLKGKAGGGGKVDELASSGTAQAALSPHEPTESDVERQRVQQVFDQVTEQLRQNPAQSSKLLQSWIHSD